VDLVHRLAASMKAGRHVPLLEVEPHPDAGDKYQIVCGEQRWRAAREAGIAEVLVRVHPQLQPLVRLEKQYEENHLRRELDPLEEANCILQARALLEIERAEELLSNGAVAYTPLEDKRVRHREEIDRHLQGLVDLLLAHGIHTVDKAGAKSLRPLSAWRETEAALGISETARKARLGLLRLPADLQEQMRTLPLEHAVQVSRLQDPVAQRELADRAADLNHKQVRAAVNHLLQERGGDIDEIVSVGVPAALTFDAQLRRAADLCRQLLRLLQNLRSRLDESQRHEVADLLDHLVQAREDYRV
jgi:hypothetical protein